MQNKTLVNAFLVVFLFATVVDSMPPISDTHQWLKETIDPVLDVTGLWQETWRLFAPEIDQTNVIVTARISYDDGSSRMWRCPDWIKMSIWERFVNFREMEFIDSVHLDENHTVWLSYADYLARTVAHPENPDAEPTRVDLVRHLAHVPPPEVGMQAPFRTLPPYDDHFSFFTRRYTR